MPKSKKPRRSRGALTRSSDTTRRLAKPPRLDLRDSPARRGTIGPKGGRPPLFPGRTGGR